MINVGVKLTAGLLVATLFVTSIPAEVMAAQPVESPSYIVGISDSFSAGAHSAIEETVVLGDVDDELYAGVEDNKNPIVAGSANPYANIAIADVDEYLNIRAEANENAEVLGKLWDKGAATVIETLDGWYKVVSGEVIGYISAEHVIVGDEETCKEVSVRLGTVNVDNLKLKKSSFDKSGVLTLLSTGSKVTILDESIEGWLKVQYNTYIGFVEAGCVSTETVYEYAESREEEEARLAAEEEARRREEARIEEEKRRQEEEQRRQEAANKKYHAPAGVSGQSVVDYAVQFVGNPYVWGGESLTNGADCSGFVMKVYEAFGVDLPHSSYYLRSVGYAVSASEVQPGDIICYSGHVAIYMGNGKIVHASNRKDGIKISNNWQYTKVLAIRRIF